MKSEPEEWIEELRPVRLSTAVKLDATLASIHNRVDYHGTSTLSIGRQGYERDERGNWFREVRKRNPAWLAAPLYLTFGDVSTLTVKIIVLKCPKLIPWRKTLLPAIRRTIKAAGMSEEGLYGGSWSLLNATDQSFWDKTKHPRYEWNGKDFRPFKA